jgi:hypothetical protein
MYILNQFCIILQDNPGESLESQLAVEKYHLEQKYASMLQQVLVQKRLVRDLQCCNYRNALMMEKKSLR